MTQRNLNAGMHIFISCASDDKPFVKDLRIALEERDLAVWTGERNLRGGSKLAPEIREAIETARQTIVVISPRTVNSPWVRQEIQWALQTEQQKEKDGYRVIPLLLPGIESGALGLWFDEAPLAIPIALESGGVSEALPAILVALGERIRQPPEDSATQPLEELLLELSDPRIRTSEGTQRAEATGVLIYIPADTVAREVKSTRFLFTAPLGPIEASDLHWYLEEYFRWPAGVFQRRAEQIEKQLPQWGQALYQATLATASAREIVTTWQHAKAECRFSIQVDSAPMDGAGKEKQKAAGEAAGLLLSLPWELLHDGRAYLFQSKHAVPVRRLPNRRPQRLARAELPIRILLVSPRPEDEHTGYIDHRFSALPLVEALENLGELVELSILTPPTFSALRQTLQQAEADQKKIDVVHFDGQGGYDRKRGLGGLCFEDPQDNFKLEERRMDFVDAEEIARVVRDHSIPLIFLEAGQSAKTEQAPTASMAAKLLEEGVTSVVAMSHDVLVETVRRFVQTFYRELANGARVGRAVLQGRQELFVDTFRMEIMGAGKLHLQDWFVPVLYQEQQDPQLFGMVLPQAVQRLQAKQRQQLSLGELPPVPPHRFIGRSRELLALERLLCQQPWAVVRGQGGAGKTTLAVELARWLVRTGRYARAAFVSLEEYTDARGVIDSLGRQLLPEGKNWSVAQYPDLPQAVLPIKRALSDFPSIIVFDNVESFFAADHKDSVSEENSGIFVSLVSSVIKPLLDANPATRILFTSREPLVPFLEKEIPGGTGIFEIHLQALDREDAIQLVSRVMSQNGYTPNPADPGSTSQEIIDLVETAGCHALALVLLAREIARQGVRATTRNLRELMARPHALHPHDRENSLYASVEFSLHRLPPPMREQAHGLAVFHGGAHLTVLAHVLEVDVESARALVIALIEMGLAEDRGYGHLHLHPALPSYFSVAGTGGHDDKKYETRWAEGMRQLTGVLYQQFFKDARLAVQLTLLELPNLLAMLAWHQTRMPPEEIIDLAGSLETLLANLGRPLDLARAVAVREEAAQRIKESAGAWSHAQFQAEMNSIERLLDSGQMQAAFEAVRQLLQQCLQAGETAYAGATYDIAMAHILLGRVLKTGGAAETALPPLAEARQRFQALADAGDRDAERMASAVIMESADCLRDLGRLDEAAAAYTEAVKRAEKRDDARQIAVGKGQLGTVRLYQRRYADALASYDEARENFQVLGEPGNIAVVWHQIGVVHRKSKHFEEAERAFRESLAIRVQHKYRADEALSLNELGNLYNDMGRLEEAVTFYRQAADIRMELQDQAGEGKIRNNLANTLIQQRRFDEARSELRRAIKCNKPYGHSAQVWMAWDIQHDLEQAAGNPGAAAEARQQASQSYLAYRRAGGESQAGDGKLCAMAEQSLQQGDVSELKQLLAQLAEEESWQVFAPKLQAILAGDRDPGLADDPRLSFTNVAELKILLADLG
ncbi:MAG: tetratricopeptide repeat protein [Gammaproteobacteria bacterium]|nr:tetratricopeptide repeat protein [Gammaproteobacteria bacterium]